ncbi:MAG: protein kinase, partial [Deltaproteobacteria bacterium]|nr:protein kinase [Deltaproteobacteria bacterium]
MLGTTLDNRYFLEQELRRSGHAVLYLATDETNGEMLAVRVLPGATLEGTRALRYLRAAEHFATLEHRHLLLPRLTAPYEAGVFQVLPYFPGESLLELLRKGPLPPEEGVPVLRQVAQALEALHRVGVAHLNLKPANVLVSREEGVVQAVLADPVQHWLRPETALDVVESAFRAPEQAPWLEGPVDERSDFYALGMLAYPLLTGRMAVAGGDVRQIFHHHWTTSPPGLRALDAALPQRLSATVTR